MARGIIAIGRRTVRAGGGTIVVDSGGGITLTPAGSAAVVVATGLSFAGNAILIDDAAAVLAQRNGTTAQDFRIYNTFTSSTNAEWFAISWAATTNVMTLRTNAGSAGGTVRDITIQPVTQLTASTTGATVSIIAGAGSASAAGGPVVITGGAAATSGAGGAFTFTTGAGAGGSSGGAIVIAVGASGTTGVGGAFTLRAGPGGTSGNRNGGNLILQPGTPNGSGTAGILEVRANTGSTAQVVRIYNTFTSTTNYESFDIDWVTTANTALLRTNAGSAGGTLRAIILQPATSIVSNAAGAAVTVQAGAGNGSGAAGLLNLNPGTGSHTAEGGYVISTLGTLTVAGSYATQRFWQITQPTISGAYTITTAVTVDIAAAATVAASAVITNVIGLRVGGATTIANAAGSSYNAIQIPTHTVTLSTTTQMTGTPSFATDRINIVTIAQSGGAVTVDSVASLYVAGPPAAGASVTLTAAYAFWVDAGISRFDGNLDFSVADATDIVLGTSTGTKIGTGTTQKLGFYNKAPAVQQTDGAALTNNVTSGGTTNQLDDFTSLSVYATDAAAIRNDIYQLGRKLKIVGDALRTYGLLS